MINEGKLPIAAEGRYDIRGFLSWEGVDIERFNQLRDQGMGHHAIMRQLHEEMENAQKAWSLHPDIVDSPNQNMTLLLIIDHKNH